MIVRNEASDDILYLEKINTSEGMPPDNILRADAARMQQINRQCSCPFAMYNKYIRVPVVSGVTGVLHK